MPSALIRQNLPALYGGVSQQSPVLRSPAQCENAENCWFSVAEGVAKRPPIEIIGELTTTDLSDAFFHWIHDQDGNRYLLVVPGDGSYAVYFLETGDPVLVQNDTGNTYLTSTGPAKDVFRAFTKGVKTYIVNRETKVTASATVNGDTLTGTVQTFADLPTGSPGNVYCIIGDEENFVDEYYVQKTASTGVWVEWIEPGIQFGINPATMPHIFTLIPDEITPANLEFDFGEETWGQRQVGDIDSNKWPSFVGQKINNLFFYKDRLGVLAGDSVVLSKIGDYTNFFRSTVRDVLDDDRIDVEVGSDDVATLYWARPLADRIILFGEERQWELTGEPALTPRTASLSSATAFNASKTAAPVSAGPNVFFPSTVGAWTHIHEMFIQEDITTTNAANISSHAFEYVPSGVRSIAAHNAESLVAVIADQEPNTLFSYQYHWEGDTKAQSAWGKWVFDPGITLLQVRAIEEFLYIVFRWSGAVTSTFYGRINLRTGDPGVATEFSHKVHLDQLQRVSGSYNGTLDKTTYVCEFPLMDTNRTQDPTLVKDSSWGAEQGAIYNGAIVRETDYSFSVGGDQSANTFLVGLPYDQVYQFSTQYYRDGNSPSLNARFYIKNTMVSFVKTGFFKTVVTSKGLSPMENEVVPSLSNTFTSRTVGDAEFLLNTPQLANGTYRIPTPGRNEDVTIAIENDSYLPCIIQSAEFEARVTTRTRRT